MTNQAPRGSIRSLLLRGTLVLSVCPGIYFVSRSGSVPTTNERSHSRATLGEISEDATQCRLRLETRQIDFGEVLEGTKNDFPLTLTNNSDELIEVTSAKATCGCTKVLTETPFVVPPHEVRELQIRMDTSRRTGELTKTVNVFVVDGPTKFRLPVDVSASVRRLVSLDTRRIDFGMLKPDQSGTQQINVTLHDTSDENAAAAVQILHCPESVSARMSEPVVQPNGETSVAIQVAIDGSNIPEEPISDDLIIRTPSTVDGVVRIPVSAMQHAWVRSDPARIDFGVVREIGDTTQTLRLQATDGHGWTVESVEIEGAPNYLKASLDSHERIQIKLDTKTAAKGFFNGKLKVRYRCGEGPRQAIVVPITGYRFVDG